MVVQADQIAALLMAVTLFKQWYTFCDVCVNLTYAHDCQVTWASSDVAKWSLSSRLRAGSMMRALWSRYNSNDTQIHT
jgi:hypothetical protein